MKDWLAQQNAENATRTLFFRVDAAAFPGEEAVAVALPVTDALYDQVARIAAHYELSLHHVSDADDTGDAGLGHEWHEVWDEIRPPAPTETLLELADDAIQVTLDAESLRADPIIEVSGKRTDAAGMEPLDCGQAEPIGFVFGVSRHYKRFQLLARLDDPETWEGYVIDEGSTARYSRSTDILMRERAE